MKGKHPRTSTFEDLLTLEIAKRLEEHLKINPTLSKEQAILSIQQDLLKNRPENPPENGRCPINDLPDELLVYIFRCGVDAQETDANPDPENAEVLDEDDDDEWEDESEEEDDDDDGDDDDEDGEGDVDITYDDPEVDDQRRRNKRIENHYRDNAYSFPLLASHICRRWRSISHETPTFWTSIDIYRCWCEDAVQAHLKRSGDLPLDIRIDCTLPDEAHEVYEESDDKDHKDLMKLVEGTGGEELRRDSCYRFLSKKDVDKILDILTPALSRWGKIEFRASLYDYISKFLLRLQTLPAAPLLERFGVYHHDEFEDYDYGEYPGEDKTAYLPFGGKTPTLREATFWGVHVDWNKAVGSFLSGLDKLELSYLTNDVRPSYTTFKKLIENSPDLVELDLTAAGPALPEGVPFDSQGAWGLTPLTISSVKTLTLQFHGIPYGQALVKHLDFPNVTELILDYEGDDYSPLVKSLCRAVGRRTDSLLRQITHLKIRGLPCNSAAAETMLSQLTSLKSLHLRAFQGDEMMFFQKLIKPSAYRRPPPDSDLEMVCEPLPDASLTPEDQLPELYCPALEEITTVYVDSNDLRDLVARRKALGVPLKKVRMGNKDDYSYDNLEWLRKNVNDFGFHLPSDSEDEAEESEWTTDDDDESDDDDDSEDDDRDDDDDDEDEDEDEDDN